MILRADYNISIRPGEDEGAVVPATFTLGSPPITIELRPSDPDAANQGWIAVASCEVGPNPRVLSVFEDLAALRPPTELDRDKLDEEFYFEIDGALRPNVVLPLSALPEPVQSFVGQQRDRLRSTTEDLVRLIRWRLRLRGGHKAIMNSRLGGGQWSLDGESWHTFPADTSLEAAIEVRRSLTAPRIEAVASSYHGGLREPVAHEMLIEALAALPQSPRSALAIGVAALEVGVKEFLAAHVPAAAWLLENLPSPPIADILESYIPELEAPRGAEARVPSRLVVGVRRAVSMRNRLIHRGTMPSRPAAVREALGYVRDVLWLLDWMSGHDWAQTELSYELLKEMGFAPAE